MKNLDFLITIFILLMVSIIGYKCYFQREQFWGGWMPVPFAGQAITRYGRTGFDAATDNPHMIIDTCACPVNPRYCKECRGYRCCC